MAVDCVNFGGRFVQYQFDLNIEKIIDTNLVLKIILYAIFLLCFCSLYFILWIPSFSRIRNELTESRKMFAMIPPDGLRDVKQIRVFLKKAIKQNMR